MKLDNYVLSTDHEMNSVINVIDAPAQDWVVNDKFLLLILITFTRCTCSLNPALSARYFQSVCSSRRVCNPTNHDLTATPLPAAPTPHQTHPPHHGNHLAFCVFLQESENFVRKLVVASNGTIFTIVCKNVESKH
jgi:hypothetical protein